jgi:hypothetical protein
MADNARALKVYLGDGVYADFDGFNLVLTTENGISVQNTIYLEPQVFNHLLLYVDRLRLEVSDAALRG